MNSRRKAMRILARRTRRKAIDLLSNDQKLWLSEVRHGEKDWQQRIRTTLRPSLAHQPQVVATEVHNSVAAQQRNLDAVRSAFRAAGVDFVELPRRARDRARLVIPQSQTRHALEALTSLRASEGWTQYRRYYSWASASPRKQRRDPFAVATMILHRRVVAPNGRVLSTGFEGVIVEAWTDLGPRRRRVDGSTHIPGTLHRVAKQPRTLVEYFTPEVWAASLANDNHTILPDAPDLYGVPDPVDLVYTWVDGSDPEWRAKKLRAQGDLSEGQINETAVSESRFADRQELLYSLRSVEAYASWVNHIYLITDAQVPDWLDTDHPKITVIDHKDIFSDQGNLPVFNSHAIESQMHHIPGLSEKYIYMNDDLFFMRPTSPELFFTGNGLSRFFPSTAPLDLSEASARDMPVLSAAKHGRDFMLNEHGRRVGNKFKHTPHPQLKSVMSDFEAEYQQLFDHVAQSKFRHPDDYSISSALYHFHAYARGKAIDSPIRYAYMDISRPDAELYMRRLLRRRNLDVLCLNDTDSTPEAQEHLDEIMHWFLSEKFPLPSSFEKQSSQASGSQQQSSVANQ